MYRVAGKPCFLYVLCSRASLRFISVSAKTGTPGCFSTIARHPPEWRSIGRGRCFLRSSIPPTHKPVNGNSCLRGKRRSRLFFSPALIQPDSKTLSRSRAHPALRDCQFKSDPRNQKTCRMNLKRSAYVTRAGRWRYRRRRCHAS
jgi:hypothetical protein